MTYLVFIKRIGKTHVNKHTCNLKPAIDISLFIKTRHNDRFSEICQFCYNQNFETAFV